MSWFPSLICIRGCCHSVSFAGRERWTCSFLYQYLTEEMILLKEMRRSSLIFHFCSFAYHFLFEILIKEIDLEQVYGNAPVMVNSHIKRNGYVLPIRMTCFSSLAAEPPLWRYPYCFSLVLRPLRKLSLIIFGLDNLAFLHIDWLASNSLSRFYVRQIRDSGCAKFCALTLRFQQRS